MEGIISTCDVFQTDSEIVNRIYETCNNYQIEYSDDADNSVCAIYFSSNDIYFPNNEEIFTKRIINKNFFEWYHTRIAKAHKHIFLRDIFKQWYLKGINKTINSPDKLSIFLQKEVKGYSNVITIGSSAGGYAAILYGSLIGAQTVFTFNPQFEINSLLERSNETINPLVFRLKDRMNKWFDIVPFITPKTEIYYFYSKKSPWDKEQHNHIPPMCNLHQISFQTAHHGIPFIKKALPVILNANIGTLNSFEKHTHNPIIFSIKLIGLYNTISGLVTQLYQAYKKRR